jgi:hypothetical protein
MRRSPNISGCIVQPEVAAFVQGASTAGGLRESALAANCIAQHAECTTRREFAARLVRRVRQNSGERPDLLGSDEGCAVRRFGSVCAVRYQSNEFVMKTTPTVLAWFTIGLAVSIEAGDQKPAVVVPPVVVSRPPAVKQVQAPYPFISSLRGTNGYYAGFFSLKSFSVPPLSSLNASTSAAKPLAQRTTVPTSTGRFHLVKAPRWLTNSLAVSNALAQATEPEAERPLPPTGLRIISISR